MREILFRGKRAGNGEWIFGSIVHQTDYYGDRCDRWFILEGDATNDYDIDYPIEVQKETVGQYTGLTDKNGRKIFEGDIIHGNLGNFIVRWSDNISGFVAGEKERTHPCLNRGTMKCYKVIGNIYDNPELVEVEK